MKWKNKELVSVGDLTDVIEKITTREEAQEFLQCYRGTGNVHADQNIGYILGYFSNEERERLYGLFGTPHPIFGTNFKVTPEEAFESGLKRGRELRDGPK